MLRCYLSKIRGSPRLVLGPVLFTLYTFPLGEICRRHEVFYLYADDTQFFSTFSVGNDVEIEEARRRIQNFISEIKMWMSFHFLKLNDDKTEVILITPRSNHNEISLPTIEWLRGKVIQVHIFSFFYRRL